MALAAISAHDALSGGEAKSGVVLPPLAPHPVAHSTTSSGPAAALQPRSQGASPCSTVADGAADPRATPPRRASGTGSGATRPGSSAPSPAATLLAAPQAVAQEQPPPAQPPFGGYGGAAATQTTYALQQAALRQHVQDDIKRLLFSSKAYTYHVKGQPALTPEGLAQLARPKPRLGRRTAEPPGLHIPDPVDWAVWKTEQLAISRMTEERRQAELAAEKRQAEAQLADFRQHKAEAERTKAAAKARKAADDETYGRSMGAYVAHKAALELEEVKERREADRERLSLQRSRQAKGFSTHHY